jgi:hypothetical protein
MNDDKDLESEERAIYAIIAVACAPVVGAVLYQNSEFDSGTTICLLAITAAIAGLATLVRRRPRLPRARIHSDR